MQKTMKKVLSLVLSLLIIMPCIGIIPVNAAGIDRTELDTVIEQAKAINADEYVDVSALKEAVDLASTSDLYTQAKIDDMTAKIQLELLKLELVKDEPSETANAKDIINSRLLSSYTSNTYVTAYITATKATKAKSWNEPVATNVFSDDSVYSKTSNMETVYPIGNTKDTVFKYAYVEYALDRYSTSNMSELGNIITAQTADTDGRNHDCGVSLIGDVASGQKCTVTSAKGNQLSYSNILKTGYPCTNWNSHSHLPHYLLGATSLTGELPQAGDSAKFMMQVYNYKNQNGSTFYCRVFMYMGIQIDSYDTTALREAIAQSVKMKSSYSADSYAEYVLALKKAMTVLNAPVTVKVNDDDTANYEDVAAAQVAIDNAANELNSAYENLKPSSDSDMDYTALDNAISLAKEKIVESEKYVSVDNLKTALDTALNSSYASQVEIDDMTERLQLELLKLELVKDEPSETANAKDIINSRLLSSYTSNTYVTAYITATKATKAKSWNESIGTNVFSDDSVYSKTSNMETVYPIGNTMDTVFKYAYAEYALDRYSTSNMSELGNIITAQTADTDGRNHDCGVSLIGDVASGQGCTVTTTKGNEVSYSNVLKTGYPCTKWDSHSHTPHYLLGATTLTGELPQAGDSAKFMMQVYNYKNQNGSTFYCNVTMLMGIQIDSYDTTALREAIARPVEAKSHYAPASYTAYEPALEKAMAVLNTPVTVKVNADDTANYENIAEVQAAIDKATEDLNNAYNALKNSFDIEYYSDGVLFQTQTVPYVDFDSTLITDVPTKPGHVFNGTWKGADGKDYTLDKVAHDFATDDGSSVRLDANFDEVIYTIKFVDGDGNVLQTSTAKYHETVSYNGATPTKATDDEFEYKFNGNWSPEIGLIEDDTIYVAQFDETPHKYNYTNSDKNGHSGECTVCGHKIENAHHHFESTEVTVNGQKMLKSVCADCNYSVTVKDYNVSVPAGCTVTKTMRTDISADYVLVTIQAPLKSGVEYFVNWVDGEGKNVGTYRTYSFFLTGDCSYSPKYCLIEDYVNTRKDAEIASRVTGINGNDDGTYSIYTEHSVSTAVGSIVGHGVLYTTDAAFGNKDSLVCGNDNIKTKAAKNSASTLTGLLEVRDKFTPGETVYARSYIITAEREVIYSEIKSFTVSAVETSSTVGTLSTELFDLTEINADTDETIEPTPEEPTNPAPQNPLDKLTSIFNKIVEFITMIIKFFKSWEVVK